MATWGRPGRPFGNLFRTETYLSPTQKELAGAAAQAAELGEPRQVTGIRFTEHTARLARRRRPPGAAPKVPLPAAQRLAELTDSGGVQHATFEELLVRTTDYEGPESFRRIPLKRLLAAYAFDAPDVPGLKLDDEKVGRVTRLSSDVTSAAQLANIAAMIRSFGYQASVNQLVPLGYVMKSTFGQAGPEPAERTEMPVFQTPDPAKREVKIAVIDTGISDQPRGEGETAADGWIAPEQIERIPDDAAKNITGNIDPLYEFNIKFNAADKAADSGNNPTDLLDWGAGHGTFVAGVVQQVAPDAKISAYRVIDGDGVGSDVDVAKALWQAAKDGAKIINLSLGTETPDDQPPLATQVALELIAETYPDVVVVAAAGNTGGTRPVWPAAFSSVSGVPQVIAVGGLTLSYEPAGWSTHGFWVDCSTAAQGVLSTFVRGRESADLDPDPDTWSGPNPWAVWSGTSFAAPQIAGAIARRYQETPDDEFEADGSMRAAVNWVLKHGCSVPDYGKVLEILPVTAIPAESE